MKTHARWRYSSYLFIYYIFEIIWLHDCEIHLVTITKYISHLILFRNWKYLTLKLSFLDNVVWSLTIYVVYVDAIKHQNFMSNYHLLTSWFWYAVTAVKIVSGKIYDLNSSFSNSVGDVSVALPDLRTRWIRGWYLCMEFKTICKKKNHTKFHLSDKKHKLNNFIKKVRNAL